MSIRDQVVQLIDQMDEHQRLKLLSIAEGLLTETPPPGTSARVLLDRMDSFTFSAGDLEQMQLAIEAAFEQVHND